MNDQVGLERIGENTTHCIMCRSGVILERKLEDDPKNNNYLPVFITYTHRSKGKKLYFVKEYLHYHPTGWVQPRINTFVAYQQQYPYVGKDTDVVAVEESTYITF